MGSLEGTLMVGQLGGPTAVINASLAGIIQEAKAHPQITAIYGLRHGLEGAFKEEYVDLWQQSDVTIQRLAHTPAAALGSGRYKLADDDFERILAVLQSRNVRFLLLIGGNGSMYVCNCIAELTAAVGYELRVMGVPKTMDNDLAGTDHSPGYGSAARFMALITRDTGRDLESMRTFDDVVILEALGRNAGWVTAASALGKRSEDEAPHLVYVPEVPFDENRFLDDVERIHRRLGRVFVVVGEGIRDSDGRFVGESSAESGPSDAMGRVVHSLTMGVAAYLTAVVREKLQLQSRFLRPGLVGRASSACVSETDRQEALRVGQQAVKHLVTGKSGLMVTLERVGDDPYRCETGVIPLADVAGTEKLLSRGFVNEAGNMVLPVFKQYALPLIDGPLPPLATVF